jgi:hypothetical protein
MSIAGIVDENVHRTDGSLDAGNGRFDCLYIGHVEADCRRPTRRQPLERRYCIIVSHRSHHAVALFQCGLRKGTAKARADTGNEKLLFD